MMNRTTARTSGLLALSLFVAACGSGSTPATSAPAGINSPTNVPATNVPDPNAEGLCGVFTADLAEAALGGPTAQPTGGDVVPRPAGIYCHYALADDANVNVEAQLKEMQRPEFDALAETLGLSEPLSGVGEAAFQRDSSIMGGPGVTLLAWNGTSGVTVTINRDGDASEMTSASAIATRALGLD